MAIDREKDLKWIRFQQRFSNLEKSFAFLKETLAFPVEGRIKQLSIIKAFEIVFELSWKSLKDVLEFQGVIIATPRSVIKEAFQAGLIGDGQAWIDFLDNRNSLIHVYNEEQASNAAKTIERLAVSQFEDLRNRLKKV